MSKNSLIGIRTREMKKIEAVMIFKMLVMIALNKINFFACIFSINFTEADDVTVYFTKVYL